MASHITRYVHLKPIFIHCKVKKIKSAKKIPRFVFIFLHRKNNNAGLFTVGVETGVGANGAGAETGVGAEYQHYRIYLSVAVKTC